MKSPVRSCFTKPALMLAAISACTVFYVGPSTAQVVKPLLKVSGTAAAGRNKAAKIAAQAWHREARRRYGISFANLAKARSVYTRCRKLNFVSNRKDTICSVQAYPVSPYPECAVERVTVGTTGFQTRELAPQSSLNGWKGRVESRFGPVFSQWRNARNRNVQYTRSNGRYYAVVRGYPCLAR